MGSGLDRTNVPFQLRRICTPDSLTNNKNVLYTCTVFVSPKRAVLVGYGVAKHFSLKPALEVTRLSYGLLRTGGGGDDSSNK